MAPFNRISEKEESTIGEWDGDGSGLLKIFNKGISKEGHDIQKKYTDLERRITC